MLTSFVTLWLLLPPEVNDSDKINHTVTLSKIKNFSEFEHSRKHFG